MRARQSYRYVLCASCRRRAFTRAWYRDHVYENGIPRIVIMHAFYCNECVAAVKKRGRKDLNFEELDR